MNTSFFLLALSIAVLGPIVAVSYLRPILQKVLVGLCDAEGGAEFWIRCAYLLAISGTMLLMLTFGVFEDASSPVASIRRSLWLVFMGVFVTVAFISFNVWSQVATVLARSDTARASPEPLSVNGDLA